MAHQRWVIPYPLMCVLSLSLPLLLSHAPRLIVWQCTPETRNNNTNRRWKVNIQREYNCRKSFSELHNHFGWAQLLWMVWMVQTQFWPRRVQLGFLFLFYLSLSLSVWHGSPLSIQCITTSNSKSLQFILVECAPLRSSSYTPCVTQMNNRFAGMSVKPTMTFWNWNRKQMKLWDLRSWMELTLTFVPKLHTNCINIQIEVWHLAHGILLVESLTGEPKCSACSSARRRCYPIWMLMGCRHF